jgi:hypothetical protein
VTRYELPFTDFDGFLADGTYRLGIIEGSADKEYFMVKPVSNRQFVSKWVNFRPVRLLNSLRPSVCTYERILHLEICDEGILKKYCVSGNCPSSSFYLKTYNVSETGFCLRLQVEPNQLGPIDRASPYLPSEGLALSTGPN